MRIIQTTAILKSSKDKVKEGSDSSPLLFLGVLGGLHLSLFEVNQRCLSLFFTLSLKILYFISFPGLSVLTVLTSMSNTVKL